MPKLSIIIPAYNEQTSLETLVIKVTKIILPENYKKEIIIINDCSKDNTLEIAKNLIKKYSEIKVLNNDINLGKSQTVRKGILASTGDFVVIQDADLEYNPEDINFLLTQLLKNNCDVAYGNRFGIYNGVIYTQNFIGNLLLSLISNIFTIFRIRVVIPDMEVCYKMIHGDVARNIAENLKATSNFGFEPEITAKLSRYKMDGEHLKFIVLPISYTPRSLEEGKKMSAFKDGFKALIEIIKYNLF
jgi:glycosyltransferase involved in cell wall biosynthesis